MLKEKIKELSDKYAEELKKNISSRLIEMEADNVDHYLIYAVLGICEDEGRKIDMYQNIGRFVYKYAGSFLEEAATICLKETYPDGIKTKIKNTLGTKPKTFEIDFLCGTDAIEVKWRDATTDGDHITKEHTRVKVISDAGYKPIRVMFYYPQRTQAIKIQETLKTLYKGIGGEYYAGEDAWDFIKEKTTVDLKEILRSIVDEKRRCTN